MNFTGLLNEKYTVKGENQQIARKFPSLKLKKEYLQNAVYYLDLYNKIWVLKIEASWINQVNNKCIFLEVIISQSYLSWIEISLCAQHIAFYKTGNMDIS